MFFCEDCAKKNGWEGLFSPFSRGPCEICDKQRTCADVPSWMLPRPEQPKS